MSVESCSPCKGIPIKKYVEVPCAYCGETALYDWGEILRQAHGRVDCERLVCPSCGKEDWVSFRPAVGKKLSDMFNFIYVMEEKASK